jgi:predicted  nucleic acid-binding Zn-ribbon protein
MNTFATALRHERLLQQEHRMQPEIERLRRLLAGDPETVRLVAALSSARDRRQELERRLREMDRETEERRSRADGRERELMSGHLRNASDLMRLRHEVDHLREVLGAAEDEELALLEEADRQDEEIGSLERGLAEHRSDAARNAENAERRLAVISDEIRPIEAGIEAAWEELPTEWRAAIERVHAHHPDAVAEVMDGLCQGCHVAVTSSGRQELRRGALLTCDNCGRILVMA